MSDFEYLETTSNTTTKKMTGEVANLLGELYRYIWCEAVYDPKYGDESKSFASDILPIIKKLNDILRFKT